MQMNFRMRKNFVMHCALLYYNATNAENVAILDCGIGNISDNARNIVIPKTVRFMNHQNSNFCYLSIIKVDTKLYLPEYDYKRYQNYTGKQVKSTSIDFQTIIATKKLILSSNKI